MASTKLPVQPRGHTVIAKTCLDCGELKTRSEFYGSKPVGDKFCIPCKRARVKARYESKREETGTYPRLIHPGIVLLAATCLMCGDLKPGDAFKRHRISTGDFVPETYRCRECRYLTEKPKTSEEAVSAMRRQREARQAETAPTARHRGDPWTGPELEIAARQDLTAREAAVLLGRTYVAVNSARQKIRHDPKWAQVAGVRA